MSKLALIIASAIVNYKNATVKPSIEQLAEEISTVLDVAEIKVWREDKRIPLPVYGKEGDACCDVYCKSVEYDAKKDRWIIHTGLHFALPDEYEMELRPRSSLTKTELYVPNAPGTLDWGYRGELLIIFKVRTNVHLFRAVDKLKDCVRSLPNVGRNKFLAACNNELEQVGYDFPFQPMSDEYEGDRICQLLIRRRERIVWDEVETLEELGDTERGKGGFGHTGGDGEAHTQSPVEEEKVTNSTTDVDAESLPKMGGTESSNPNRFAK